MNFGQMKTQVGQFIQDSSSVREVRIADSINRRYDEIARGTDWQELIRIFENEVTVNNGEANVYLPSHFDVVKKITDTNNNRILESFDAETFFERNFDRLATTGPAQEYTHAGMSAVKREISSAETLDFVSSDSGDTGITVQVWGLVSGDEVNESVTLNGTTPVATSNSFSRITKIGTDATSLNSQRTGVITISGTTSSTEYATIVPQQPDSRYGVIRVWPTPSAGTTLTTVYKKKVAPLVNDQDTLELDIGPAIVELSIADILRQQRKWNASQVHESRGQKILNDYLARLQMQSEQIFQSVPSKGETLGKQTIVVRST